MGGRKQGQTGREMGRRGASLALWAALGIFVLYPLGRLFVVATTNGGGFSPTPLLNVMTDSYSLAAMRNTAILATAVATAGTAIGFAFALSSSGIPIPRWLGRTVDSVVVLPLVSPPFMTGISLSILLGPGGTIPNLIGMPDLNLYGFWGTWLAEIMTYFPLAYLALSAVLEGIDGELEESAMTLGATRLQAFRKVTVPLAIPGLANSFLLLFGASLADFASPMVMGGHDFPVLTTQAYLRITGMYDLQGGAALSLFLIIPAIGVYLIQRRWTENREFTTISGKGGRDRPRRSVETWEKWVLTVVASISSFLLVVYGTILTASLVRAWGLDNSFTLEHYGYALSSGLGSIKDTVLLATTATVIGTVVSVTAGYLVTKRETPLRRTMEATSLLNSILPGTAVGIAYVIAFNSGPIILTGTMTILVALCVFRYGAAAMRLTIASLSQMDRSLEEAAMNLGASSFTVFRKITVPLIAPAISGGMKSLFVISMTAISAMIFLVSVRWNLLTVRILECITELMFGQAAALSVVLVTIVFSVSKLIDRLFRVRWRS